MRRDQADPAPPPALHLLKLSPRYSSSVLHPQTARSRVDVEEEEMVEEPAMVNGGWRARLVFRTGGALMAALVVAMLVANTVPGGNGRRSDLSASPVALTEAAPEPLWEACNAVRVVKDDAAAAAAKSCKIPTVNMVPTQHMDSPGPWVGHGALNYGALNPGLNSDPTLNPQPQALNPTPRTLHPTPQPLNPEPGLEP